MTQRYLVAGAAECAHLGDVADVDPSTSHGCEDCLRAGTRWVHLRMCLSCGRVGCCDSSPERHASGHAREAAHPVIRSMEPGEDWGWCYVDGVVLAPVR